MSLSATSAGNQAVMSDDRPLQFLDMAFCGHARRTLPPEIVELIDDFATDLSEANGAPIEGTTKRLFRLAMAVHNHAEDRHTAYLERLAERLEGSTNGNL